LATAAASTSSAKSTVPTTSERLAGSVTNGVAYSDASAHEYRCVEEPVVRSTQPSRPPSPSIHSSWSASSTSVAIAGVL
jgi:hypothetical protein